MTNLNGKLNNKTIMRTIETNIYTIEDHPNKDKCFEWIRDNWHDLNEHSVHEVIDSIKALSKEIGGTCDYKISQVPSEGEYIKFKNYSQEDLYKLNADDCPLTGVSWDYDLIEGLKEGNPNNVLETIHKETEYIYSDEGLYELCVGNDYEFNESGSIYN
tara:strand:+ start:53 stop:529 length:477 start_codon:yes stop_codon:yes gene_type:complete